MKTLFRILKATVVTAVCLLVLKTAYSYFLAESLLGPTVEQVVKLCFLALSAIALLLYLYCFTSYIVDACRARAKKKKEAKKGPSPTVQLTIGEQDAPRLYDDDAPVASVKE